MALLIHLIALVGVFCVTGCCTLPAVRVGYLLQDQTVVSSEYSPPPARSEFVFSRNSQTNALPVEIGTAKRIGARSAFIRENYIVQIHLSSNREISAGTYSTFVPGLHSANIENLRAISSASGGIEITFSANAVGVDLFLSQVISPSGLEGLLFDESGRAYLMRASSFSPGSRWGTVLLKEGKKDKLRICIVSDVEYPIVIRAISIGEWRSKRQYVIQPWSSLEIPIPPSAKADIPHRFAIEAHPARTAPVHWKTSFPAFRHENP